MPQPIGAAARPTVHQPRRAPGGHVFESPRVDLSSHNTNPPGVFDGEAIPLSDVADRGIEASIAALREFVAEHGSLPTAESWTEAAMRPSEKTIRRRFGSFREAIQRAALT
jgi:Homing endonuclease associated repeat